MKNTCNLLEIIEKKILLTVEVIAIGRNSETCEKFSDFDNKTMNAQAQSTGMSFVFQIFRNSCSINFKIAGYFL